MRLLTRAHQWKHSAWDHRNISPPNDLEQPESMSNLLIPPLIPADHRDPKHLDLRRLQKDQQSLQVAASRPGAVLIDDDFAARLGKSAAASQQQADNCQTQKR